MIPLAFVPILKMSRHSNIKIYKAVCLQEFNI